MLLPQRYLYNTKGLHKINGKIGIQSYKSKRIEDEKSQKK